MLRYSYCYNIAVYYVRKKKRELSPNQLIITRTIISNRSFNIIPPCILFEFIKVQTVYILLYSTMELTIFLYQMKCLTQLYFT